MRGLFTILVAAAIVFGILKYRDKLNSLYGRHFSRENKLWVSTGGEPGQGGSGGAVDAPLVKGTGQFLKAARPELTQAVAGSISLPEACKPYVAEVQVLDLLELEKNRYRVSYQQLPRLDERCRFTDAKVLAVLRNMQTACRPGGSASDSISETCAFHLFMLRAVLTRQMFASRPLSSISDMRVLTDLMFAEFAEIDSQTVPNMRMAGQVADRMLELDPKMYVAAKVGAFSEAVTTLEKKQAQGGKFSDQDWASARDAIARARHLNPDDASLEPAEALVATHGFEPEKCISYAAEQIRQNSGMASAWYLKAYGEWKLGQKDTARASLKRAVELAPGSREYAQILVAISQPDAGLESFQGALTFGVRPQDFER